MNSIPADLDPELAAAMVPGGIRQALGAGRARPAPPPQDTVVDMRLNTASLASRREVRETRRPG